MKDRLKTFKNYEIIRKMDIEIPIILTPEYQNFSKVYPRIAESIELERKIERLTKMLKSESHKNSKIQIKREINITKTKLRKNKLIKRLHGDNKQEAILQKKYKQKNPKIHYLTLIKKGSQLINNVKKKISQNLHKNLPPSIFNLRELTVSEKGMELREWLQEKNTKRQ